MKVISAYNIKGGVGKTSTAVNLAWLCSQHGYSTLLWDLDPQGAATFYFRIKMKKRDHRRSLLKRKKSLDNHIRGTDFENLDVLRAYFSNRAMDTELAGETTAQSRIKQACDLLAIDYDYVILDCPPSISTVADNVFAASDALLVPTIPTTLSIRTLHQLRAHLVSQSLDDLLCLPFFSMVDPRNSIHRAVINQPDRVDKRMLSTSIPYATEIEQMGVFRAPVPSFAPDSTAAVAYQSLWTEVHDIVG